MWSTLAARGRQIVDLDERHLACHNRANWTVSGPDENSDDYEGTIPISSRVSVWCDQIIRGCLTMTSSCSLVGQALSSSVGPAENVNSLIR